MQSTDNLSLKNKNNQAEAKVDLQIYSPVSRWYSWSLIKGHNNKVSVWMQVPQTLNAHSLDVCTGRVIPALGGSKCNKYIMKYWTNGPNCANQRLWKSRSWVKSINQDQSHEMLLKVKIMTICSTSSMRDKTCRERYEFWSETWGTNYGWQTNSFMLFVTTGHASLAKC